MLLSRDAVAVAMEHTSAGEFYKPAHGHIFEAITYLYDRNEPADTVSVSAHLEQTGLLDAVGGQNVLIDLMVATPSTAHAARYARIVSGHALVRRVISVGSEIVELGYESGPDAEAVVDAAASLLYPLADRRRTSQAELVKDLLGPWLDSLEARWEGKEQGGLLTGWYDLDELLVGMTPGQLITICGRPAMSKTGIGLAIALHVATTGIPALVVSAEMSDTEVLDRLMAASAQVDSLVLRSGQVTERDWPRISDAIGRVGALPLWIDDNAGATLASIRAQVRRATQRGGSLGLLVVDYIQLVSAAGKTENRQTEVAEISRGLKRLALEAGIPVICLAQINRQVEQRADKRPTLSDLRESGAIEADSNIVIGLYRDEVYNPDTEDKGIIELIVLKNRSGPLGTVELAADLRYGHYRNMRRGA